MTYRGSDHIRKCIKENGVRILTMKRERSKYQKGGYQNEPCSVELESEVSM